MDSSGLEPMEACKVLMDTTCSRMSIINRRTCCLWIGTESGLLRFNYNQGNYADFDLSAELQALSSTLVDKVYVTEEGILWVVTSDSMYVVKVDHKKNLLSSYGKESAG